MIRLCAFSDEAASSLSGQISALKQNGIFLTELRSVDGKNVSSFTPSQAKEYARVLKEEGIGVWAIGSPLGKADIACDFEKYLDTVKKVCEIADIFGTSKIRAFSFYNAQNERERVFGYMQRMAETAASFGVTLYHENEKEIYGDTLSRVLDIAENVKGWKFVYDPANFIQVGERAEDTINALMDKTDYFHIKDVCRKTGELVPAGYGDGKIDVIIDKINKDTVFTVEPHLAVFEAYKSIDGTEMKHKFSFSDNMSAFNAAVAAIKNLLESKGFAFENGEYFKG